MTAKYEHIATITLDSSASSVTFSSIPQGYRDLELVTNAKYTGGDRTTMEVYLNSDTGANYSFVWAGTDGSTTNSTSTTDNHFYSLVSNVLGTVIYQFMDYSATDKHKTLLTRISDTGPTAVTSNSMLAQRWANTSGITTIKFQPFESSIAAGSTFDLYGIVGGA